MLENPEKQRLQFMDKDGKALDGHYIHFQLVCVFAPERMTQLSVLAGTWNIGTVGTSIENCRIDTARA